MRTIDTRYMPSVGGIVLEQSLNYIALADVSLDLIYDKYTAKLVFIGDSITHLFGGPPESDFATADDVWKKYYDHRLAANLGFGWDRIQQMLWRIDNGELDCIAAKVFVVMAGGNNLLAGNAPVNTPDEIVTALQWLCDRILQKTPNSQI